MVQILAGPSFIAVFTIFCIITGFISDRSRTGSFGRNRLMAIGILTFSARQEHLHFLKERDIFIKFASTKLLFMFLWKLHNDFFFSQPPSDGLLGFLLAVGNPTNGDRSR